MKTDISTASDIKILVDSFYKKIEKDPLLGPIFISKIKNDWTQHLEKMYGFWETVLLNVHRYSGSPFLPHAKLPIEATHFERWLQLFKLTLDEHFVGKKADEAYERARKMAQMFQIKIAYYAQSGTQPL